MPRSGGSIVLSAYRHRAVREAFIAGRSKAAQELKIALRPDANSDGILKRMIHRG
ncbi:hypothetical protein DOTSEDRAFT_46684 [Dothistroma septosporum NZE10]|uniref:Uncharacterized protein n=1 Tax=Dothistroma septosporum (strain NZE10 / CBS 128990) TaxID=675120 RepID=N1PGP1_DOTSN|nr:hypothetical protein DOTSEDRAFT_46684 [Dothistroma septosporum NZE10]